MQLRQRGAPAAFIAVWMLCATTPVVAQQVRVRSTTTARFVQLQPLVLDSTGNFMAGGLENATPVTEDIELSAWGFGVTGLRFYGQFRFRGALGSELVWPRYDDHFDALNAFVELDRSAWRVRAGRQQRVSALGIYTFDGASGLWRPRRSVRLEAFVGRGLARGFLEPLSSDAIQAIEPTRPDQATLLVGATAMAMPARGWTVAGAWQREILWDLSGLVSERVSLDAHGPLGRRFTASGYVDGDIAAEAVGKARLSLAWTPPGGMLAVEGFRYRPLFDLTTIWGAFSPEAHYGFTTRGEVAAGRGLVFTGDLTWRRYEPITESTPFLVGVGDHSTSLAVGARWTREALALDGRYRLLTGYGGAQSGGDIHATWARPGARWTAGLRVVAFQEDEQFRVADGTVFGLGADGTAKLLPTLNVRAELAQYWHQPSEGDVTLNWTQTRALLAVQWTFGTDPDRLRPR